MRHVIDPTRPQVHLILVFISLLLIGGAIAYVCGPVATRVAVTTVSEGVRLAVVHDRGALHPGECKASDVRLQRYARVELTTDDSVRTYLPHPDGFGMVRIRSAQEGDSMGFAELVGVRPPAAGSLEIVSGRARRSVRVAVGSGAGSTEASSFEIEIYPPIEIEVRSFRRSPTSPIVESETIRVPASAGFCTLVASNHGAGMSTDLTLTERGEFVLSDVTLSAVSFSAVRVDDARLTSTMLEDAHLRYVRGRQDDAIEVPRSSVLTLMPSPSCELDELALRSTGDDGHALHASLHGQFRQINVDGYDYRRRRYTEQVPPSFRALVDPGAILVLAGVLGALFRWGWSSVQAVHRSGRINETANLYAAPDLSLPETTDTEVDPEEATR